MRWFVFHCILLTSLSLASAADGDHTKRKRDLAFVKNLFKSAILNNLNDNRNYKIFKIPGFNNILVKAVPKATVSAATVVPVPDNVGVIAQDPAVALVGSYLGTKTPVDTLNALQGVKNLLESGILAASRDAIPLTFQPPSTIISAIRKTEKLPISSVAVDSAKTCNEATEVQKPMYVVQTIAERPVLTYEIPKPIVPRPIVSVSVPNIVETIHPVQVAIPALPTNYSYKQIHEDGTMTSYTGNDNHDVTVVKSDKPLPLPPFMAYRLREVIKLGTQIVGVEVPVPVLPIMQPPVAQFINYPKINPYTHVKPEVIRLKNKYSYKQVHNDGTMTANSGLGSTDLNNIRVVTEVGRRPAVPAFISDRLEKVVASTVSSKLPNPVVLAGQTVIPTYRYSTIVTGNPNFTTKENVEVKINNNLNHNAFTNIKPASAFLYRPVINTANNAKQPSGSFSYKLVHSDAVPTLDQSIVQQEAGISILDTTASNIGRDNTNPTSGFSYQLVHNGLASNNGKEESSSSKSVQKVTEAVNTELGNSNSFSYKTVHGDGSVTTYTMQDVNENKDKKLVATVPEQLIVNSNSKINGQNLPKNYNLTSIGSSGHSYKLIHNAISTNNYVQTANSLAVTPVSVPVASSDAILFKEPVVASYTYKQIPTRPLSPALLNNKIDNIAKTNAGSFSYSIEHSDGTATTYDASGEHTGKSYQIQTGEQLDAKRIVEVNLQKDTENNGHIKTTKNIITNPKDGFSYKTVHNDGNITSYQKDLNSFGQNPLITTGQVNYLPLPISATGLECPQSVVLCQQLSNDATKNDMLPSGSFSYKLVNSDIAHTLDSSEVQQKAGISTPGPTTTDITKTNANSASGLSYKLVQGTLASKNFEQGSSSAKSVHKTTEAVNAEPGITNSYSYKTVHSDSSVTSYTKQGVKENNDGKLVATSTNIPVQQKVSTNRQVNSPNLAKNNNVAPIASSGHSYKLIHNGISTNNNVQTANLQPVTPVSVAVAGSDAVLFNRPIVSSYTYKQLYHNSPNNFTVVKLDGPILNKVVIDDTRFPGSENINSKDDSIPNNYVYIPPTSVNVPPLTKPEKMPLSDDGYVYIPPASANAPLPVNNEQNVQKHSQASSLSTNPIVVLDDPTIFSYRQSNSDGSSMKVEGSKNTVSVKVAPQTLNRGDIPDESY